MEPPADDDARLLLAYRERGDREALERLLRNHADLAYRTALGALGNPADAEDAVQVAFMQVLLHAGRYRPGRGAVRPWFIAIVINACRMQRRAARRRATHERGAAPSAPPPPEPDERLAAALAALDERFRIAVSLRFLEGLGFAEIATAQGVPERTARSRVSRGLERLRDALGRPGDAAAIAAALPAAVPLPTAPPTLMAAAGSIARMDPAHAAAALGGSSVLSAWVLGTILAVLLAGGAIVAASSSRGSMPSASAPPPPPPVPPAVSPLDQEVVVHLFDAGIVEALSELRLVARTPLVIGFCSNDERWITLVERWNDRPKVSWPNREGRAQTVRALLDEIARQAGCVWRAVDGEAYVWLPLAPETRRAQMALLSEGVPRQPSGLDGREGPFGQLDADLDAEEEVAAVLLPRMGQPTFDALVAERICARLGRDNGFPGLRGLESRSGMPPLARALGHDPSLRAAAVAALARPLPGPSQSHHSLIAFVEAARITAAGPRLIELLDHAAPELGTAAAQALGAIRYRPAVPALAALAKRAPELITWPAEASPDDDSDPQVVRASERAVAALLSLAMLDEPMAVPWLVALLKQNSRFAPRYQVLTALLQIHGADADRELQRLLRELGDEEVAALAGLLAEWPRPGMVATCRERLRRPTPAYAALALLQVLATAPEGPDQLLDHLRHADAAAADDQDPRFHADNQRWHDQTEAIIRALEHLRDPSILERLALGIEGDASRQTRRIAAATVADSGDTKATALVRDLLRRHVRDAIGADAAYGLIRSRDPELVAEAAAADLEGRIPDEDRPMLLSCESWLPTRELRDHLAAVVRSGAATAIRSAALGSLMNSGDPEAAALADELRADPDERLRGGASLCEQGDQDGERRERLLRQALADPHPYVRQCALSVLDERREASLRLLEDSLAHDPDWRVRRIAVQKLVDLIEGHRTESSRDAQRTEIAGYLLAALARDPASSVRAAAAWGITAGAWMPFDVAVVEQLALEVSATSDASALVRSVAEEGAETMDRVYGDDQEEPPWQRSFEPEWGEEAPPMEKR